MSALQRLDAIATRARQGWPTSHDVDDLVDALRAILDLHRGTHSCGSIWFTDDDAYHGTIARREPCPTVVAIESALGGAR